MNQMHTKCVWKALERSRFGTQFVQVLIEVRKSKKISQVRKKPEREEKPAGISPTGFKL